MYDGSLYTLPPTLQPKKKQNSITQIFGVYIVWLYVQATKWHDEGERAAGLLMEMCWTQQKTHPTHT